jgi:hypothetical protein
MANPWDNDPIVRSRKTDPRIEEREQAETRYRNLTGDANPLARPVILPGEEGYAGSGQYLPEADVVVRGNMPWANDLQVTPGSEAIRANANPLGAFAAGAAEQIPFLDEAAAWTVAKLNGDSYDYVRETQRMASQIDREEQPLARNIGGVSGFAAGVAAPGSAYVRGAQGATQIVRAATLGAGYGGLYGAGAAEDGYASRLAGLGTGAAVGGVTGGALQAAAPLVSRATGAASRGLNSIVNPSGRVRARGNVTPEMSAASRLSEFVTPESLIERQRLIDLGLEPAAMDVLGGTAERLVRTAAGPAGPGAEMAVQGAVQRQANLRPEVMSVTRGLSDDPRSAEAVREGLLDTRSRLADEMYPEAYATPVEVTNDLLAAISDEPGRAALRRARSAAVARQDANQVAEIDGLIAGDTAPVSAGTIDRVRIAMRGRAQAMQQRPDTRDIAGGLFGREAQIDTALEGVEALAPARAQYRALSGAADVIDNRPDIFSTDPQDFRSWVDTLSPEARDAAIIGVRQDILDTLGRQRNAGSGSLDTLTQAQYSRDNLSALLGPEEAQRYLDSIAARVQGAQRAQRVSPNTNSQTFGRGMDEETLGVAERLGAVTDAATGVMGNLGGIARTIDRIRARTTMSPEERAAIVQMGLGSADELERIVMLADQARASNRPPPREVRAWLTNATARLGANNPAARELQQLLLPAISPAQETETQP